MPSAYLLYKQQVFVGKRHSVQPQNQKWNTRFFFASSKSCLWLPYTVVKWVSIIWLFDKKNIATQKIWEFVVPEIFRILVNELFKLAQKTAIFCQAYTFVQLLSCALLCKPQKTLNVYLICINVPKQRNPAQTCNFYCYPILKI